MPTHHDVFHFQVPHGELHDAQQTEVRRVDDVGDVAVGEDVAGFEAEDGGLGLTGVGAAEPEDLGRLAFGEGWEEVWVVLGCVRGPFLVVLKALLERVVCGEGGMLVGRDV